MDVGRKTIETGWGLPEVKQPDGAAVMSLSQEHGRLRLGEGNRSLRIGDKVELWVRDANNTINLYDLFYALRGDCVEAVWEIPGRGAST
jgi:D-serine deaminase-like pyridoxal phosphate-dependent protein